MNILIVFCHPEPQSFNGALKEVAKKHFLHKGHQVEVSDLYADGFDPTEHPRHFPIRADGEYFAPLTEQRNSYDQGNLPQQIHEEIEKLERADLVIFQFPLWWHAQPAMLKGWFDRVFVYGGIYSGSVRFDRGRFVGKKALCSVTTGAPEATFSPFGRSGDIIQLMWPIHCSLYYVGFDVLAPQITYGVQGGGLKYVTDENFRKHLENSKDDYANRLAHLAEESPIPFTGWDDWDENGELDVRHPARWRA
ncbi:NAD(P)H-dependent oxidoreductase [Hahella ganghwensis]|uniref:NAD(P)H-dependent oxidoreductase n=1 Tax=Hahella ganghwensis TaxID=286420 RepID=UPI0003660924|nr:NAD(P)H-dependent oxidoreductase [Hahella ganghwensis]